ncbi:MAG TPA: DNA recombination protein RmuC [Methylophaga aminisulfidivorans]|uniref:DNA recombination protein RmuC n=1 Tax=Methylophaga aminisulfidivorans TaxID=230105 RepID=A0A7C1ZRF5_9GAMM|nr:DNA recombination protein RmuC [Methylophaga aminisulfidivorans]
MQLSLWTNEMIAILVISSLFLALVTYLITRVIHTRKITLLSAHNNQLEATNQQQLAEIQRLQSMLDESHQQLHQFDLDLSRAEQQLQTAATTEKRLEASLATASERQQALQSLADESRAQHHRFEKDFESSQTKLRSTEQYLVEIKQSLNEKQAAYEAQQQRYQQLSSEHTELKTTLEKREEHFKEQMQQLTESKQALTKEFENIANKIFEEKGKTFTDTSKSSIDVLLKPFREQIEGFQKRINEVHDSSLRGNSHLNAEIKKVLDIGLKMSSEANNLTSALKGDSQQRGAWGEAQLRRTLEMSGLVEDAHFEVQTAFKDADGKQKQTDYLIKLPDKKHIIIDSKVSLNAYDRAVSADSEEAYQLSMAEHIKAVRRHIDDLASKDYTNVIGMRSPSFVLMFMPIEPAYIEALKNNKDLFEYGYKKGIVLVSHTTLIPILRTVSNLWMMERSNAEAREISEKAGDIYNQVAIVAERLQRLGNTLGTVSNQYNQVIKGLAGKQGLYGKVDRFSQLSTKVSKSLPQLETVERDYETEPLTMIIEAIEEDDSTAIAFTESEPMLSDDEKND